MTNHNHFLGTPNKEGAVSRMIQLVVRMYVRYFNKTCRQLFVIIRKIEIDRIKRTGTFKRKTH